MCLIFDRPHLFVMSKAASSPLAGVHWFCSSSSAGFQPTDATQACAYDHDVKVSGLFFENAFFENAFFENFETFGGLVLGCIKTKFCKKICVRQHFSRSTRFAYFCTTTISKF